ncbi:MAG TPA: SDR family NAD(P)-dependent oxidoreductase [Sphingobacteriaceae bacterium]
MKQLENKVALVTGGSRGIGASIVTRLAREGASVAFTYSNGKEKADNLVKELLSEGLSVTAFQADNSVQGNVTSAIDQCISLYGKLDILVNNAGIYIGKPFEEHTLEDYQQTMDVNVRAVVEACLTASRKMESAGRIITIGSCMADRVPFPQGTLYSMSKSALIGLTKGLARDLGHKAITVNLIQPGPVNTDMNPEDGEYSDAQRNLMAIPHYGKPYHIAALVGFLAGPDGSYSTGSSFTMDGGTTI